MDLPLQNFLPRIGRSLFKYGLSATVPMPIQIVIDDVGWWSGEDGNEIQQPYRTGIEVNHVPADYQAIVDLGPNWCAATSSDHSM